MSAHSPTPWRASDSVYHALGDATGLEIAVFEEDVDLDEVEEDTHDRANVNRAVACVNACAELPDPAETFHALREFAASMLNHSHLPIAEKGETLCKLLGIDTDTVPSPLDDDQGGDR